MSFAIYAVTAALLVGLGLHGAIRRRHLIRRILALNIVGGGVFLLLIAFAREGGDGVPDPVPQALVLTGIVVAVSVSGLAIAIARRIHAVTGETGITDRDLE